MKLLARHSDTSSGIIGLLPLGSLAHHELSMHRDVSFHAAATPVSVSVS